MSKLDVSNLSKHTLDGIYNTTAISSQSFTRIRVLITFGEKRPKKKHDGQHKLEWTATNPSGTHVYRPKPRVVRSCQPSNKIPEQYKYHQHPARVSYTRQLLMLRLGHIPAVHDQNRKTHTLTFEIAAACDSARRVRSSSSWTTQGLTLSPPSTPGFAKAPVGTSTAPRGPLTDFCGFSLTPEGPVIEGVCPRRQTKKRRQITTVKKSR